MIKFFAYKHDDKRPSLKRVDIIDTEINDFASFNHLKIIGATIERQLGIFVIFEPIEK